MTKYLYGASIQGIQDFLFKTDKLKEIVGASEIVEEICTDFFKSECPGFLEDNLIIGAAGNIKYLFELEEDCKALVRKFPMLVGQKAPGITLSQAVVKFEDELTEAVEKLEGKLKAQRNQISLPMEMGYHALKRERRTDGIVSDFKNKIDIATVMKWEAAERGSKNLFKDFIGKEVDKDNQPLEISDIVKGQKNSWIAVIHADGNGLGKLVQNLSVQLKDNNFEVQKSAFKSFSKALEEGTKKAAQEAIKDVLNTHAIEIKGDEKYPFRPVILGGDDITLIIRGDLALPFLELFMDKFEIYVNDYVGKALAGIVSDVKISICAGIAYVKDSYPFHYGVDLADKLCAEAKAFSKSKSDQKNVSVPSSLSFFKVQDSFIEHHLEDLRDRTGLAKASSIDYNFGPYLLIDNGDGHNIPNLNKKLEVLRRKVKDKKDKTRAVSKLRQLVSESFINPASFGFMKDRILEVDKDFYNDIGLDQYSDSRNKSIYYELIQIHTIHE